MAVSLEDFARGIPDGAFWVTGEFFKEFCDVLVADRARAGANMDELPTPKGRFLNAKAGGASASTLDPLTIIVAATQALPGRIRVVNGTLGGLLPDEMTVPDIVLPNGTDNHCYLTMSVGTNYIYGKVLVDSDTGLFTDSDVYVVTSPEQPDGTYAYLQIGTVSFDGSNLTILSQDATGNQSLAVLSSADGSTLLPVWSSQG